MLSNLVFSEKSEIFSFIQILKRKIFSVVVAIFLHKIKILSKISSGLLAIAHRIIIFVIVKHFYRPRFYLISN